MTIYDFIKTHTIDEIAEEVTKDLDVINKEACYECAHFIMYCGFSIDEYMCPRCLENRKKRIKEEIKHALNLDVEGN